MKTRFYISSTPVPENKDLSRKDFEAIGFVEVRDLGELDADSADSCESKVTFLSMSPHNDTGLYFMQAAGRYDDIDHRAFKVVNEHGEGEYWRGLVVGPKVEHTADDDFARVTYHIARTQPAVSIKPKPQVTKAQKPSGMTIGKLRTWLADLKDDDEVRVGSPHAVENFDPVIVVFRDLGPDTPRMLPRPTIVGFQSMGKLWVLGEPGPLPPKEQP